MKKFKPFAFILIATSLLMLSCRATAPALNSTTKSREVPLPTGPASNGVTTLTGSGENYRPRLSPDGTHLLFLSEKRASHTQAQVYELNLVAHTERRITFQDGTVYDATYAGAADAIIYSSNTDEIKENPAYIRQALLKYKSTPQPTPTAPTKVVGEKSPTNNFVRNSFGGDMPLTDIYVGGRDGRDIKRLTSTAAFDGEIAVRPKHNEAIVVVDQKGTLQLGLLSIHGNGVMALPPEKDKKNDEWPAYSSDGKQLVWMHFLGPSESEIWIGGGHAEHAKRLLGGGGAIYAWPVWTPDMKEIVFASNKEDANVFKLFAVKSDGTCLRKITNGSTNEGEPALSPDGKTLYFTSDRSGQRQIYSVLYATVSQASTCPSEPATVK